MNDNNYEKVNYFIEKRDFLIGEKFLLITYCLFDDNQFITKRSFYELKSNHRVKVTTFDCENEKMTKYVSVASAIASLNHHLLYPSKKTFFENIACILKDEVFKLN